MTAAPQPPLPPAPVLGPFRVGMTIDEAVATNPDLAWDQYRSEFTDKVLLITAPDALTRSSATVTAACQVPADRSLICIDERVDPPELTEFAIVPNQLAPLYTATPQLRSGEPAAGAWVRLVIEFRPADE